MQGPGACKIAPLCQFNTLKYRFRYGMQYQMWQKWRSKLESSMRWKNEWWERYEYGPCWKQALTSLLMRGRSAVWLPFSMAKISMTSCALSSLSGSARRRLSCSHLELSLAAAADVVSSILRIFPSFYGSKICEIYSLGMLYCWIRWIWIYI